EPALLGAALSRLLADPEARAAMGSRGSEAAARHFSWQAIAGRMELIYDAILAVDRLPAALPASS
ncbi:MAG TPA: glycosyltransferase family 1 protein, partial [Thermoanaerobaculia bacterium]|nr:glycosyltransferase family 1 protein [Thermoanaerobaculia bacterium]